MKHLTTYPTLSPSTALKRMQTRMQTPELARTVRRGTLVAVGLWLAASTLTAQAASSAASLASESLSTSVESLSNSISKSSTSSSPDNHVAEGPYVVREVAVVQDRPNHLRLRLEASTAAGEAARTPAQGAAQGELFLYVPLQTVAEADLKAGQVVNARQREFGYEFARQGQNKPFLLVLRDEWYHELATRPVTL